MTSRHPLPKPPGLPPALAQALDSFNAQSGVQEIAKRQTDQIVSTLWSQLIRAFEDAPSLPSSPPPAEATTSAVGAPSVGKKPSFASFVLQYAHRSILTLAIELEQEGLDPPPKKPSSEIASRLQALVTRWCITGPIFHFLFGHDVASSRQVIRAVNNLRQSRPEIDIAQLYQEYEQQVASSSLYRLKAAITARGHVIGRSQAPGGAELEADPGLSTIWEEPETLLPLPPSPSSPPPPPQFYTEADVDLDGSDARGNWNQSGAIDQTAGSQNNDVPALRPLSGNIDTKKRRGRQATHSPLPPPKRQKQEDSLFDNTQPYFAEESFKYTKPKSTRPAIRQPPAQNLDGQDMVDSDTEMGRDFAASPSYSPSLDGSPSLILDGLATDSGNNKAVSAPFELAPQSLEKGSSNSDQSKQHPTVLHSTPPAAVNCLKSAVPRQRVCRTTWMNSPEVIYCLKLVASCVLTPWLVVDSHTLKQLPKNKTLSQDLARDVARHKTLVLPLFVSGNHWSLAVLHSGGPGTTPMADYYDSLRCRAHSREAEDHLNVFCRTLLPSVSPLRALDAACPQQENGSDCGVFVVAYLAHLAAGVALSSSLDGRLWRIIVHVMLKSSNTLIGAPAEPMTALETGRLVLDEYLDSELYAVPDIGPEDVPLPDVPWDRSGPYRAQAAKEYAAAVQEWQSRVDAHLRLLMRPKRPEWLRAADQVKRALAVMDRLLCSSRSVLTEAERAEMECHLKIMRAEGQLSDRGPGPSKTNGGEADVMIPLRQQ
ncbi:ulp1 protease family protein [Colletotrichum tofieldiae]|nr:ulp1 protease family protein [Colletotrichum tofieldiae]